MLHSNKVTRVTKNWSRKIAGLDSGDELTKRLFYLVKQIKGEGRKITDIELDENTGPNHTLRTIDIYFGRKRIEIGHGVHEGKNTQLVLDEILE